MNFPNPEPYSTEARAKAELIARSIKEYKALCDVANACAKDHVHRENPACPVCKSLAALEAIRS